jgi:hypothetical protein
MWLHIGALQEYKKMNLQPYLNKNSPQALMQTKFDVLGIAAKLVKYVAYLFKK